MFSLERNPGQYIVIDSSMMKQVIFSDELLKLSIGAPKEILIERGNNTKRSIRLQLVSSIPGIKRINKNIL